MNNDSVCVYTRGQPGLQVRHGISVAEQASKIRAFAEANGWEVVAEFSDTSLLASDLRRPAFEAMLIFALAEQPRFRRIVFHSMSRFFRDEMHYEMFRRKLGQNGVELISITKDSDECSPVKLWPTL